MSDKNDEGKERERVTKEEMERVLWRGKEWVQGESDWEDCDEKAFLAIRALISKSDLYEELVEKVSGVVERIDTQSPYPFWSPSVAELFVTIRAILARIEGK